MFLMIKRAGLIVDYVGIASALKAAMKEYTKRDQSKYGDMNIAKVAYPKFQENYRYAKICFMDLILVDFQVVHHWSWQN